MERQNSEAERFERAPPEKQEPASIRSCVYPLRYHNRSLAVIFVYINFVLTVCLDIVGMEVVILPTQHSIN